MRIIKDLSELYKIIQPDFFIKFLKEMCYDNTFGLTWYDLGMDELDFIEMIMEIEKEYDIVITDDMVGSIENMEFLEFYSNLTSIKRNNVLEKLGI